MGTLRIIQQRVQLESVDLRRGTNVNFTVPLGGPRIRARSSVAGEPSRGWRGTRSKWDVALIRVSGTDGVGRM